MWPFAETDIPLTAEAIDALRRMTRRVDNLGSIQMWLIIKGFAEVDLCGVPGPHYVLTAAGRRALDKAP
jgi:hypothetical protein